MDRVCRAGVVDSVLVVVLDAVGRAGVENLVVVFLHAVARGGAGAVQLWVG